MSVEQVLQYGFPPCSRKLAPSGFMQSVHRKWSGWYFLPSALMKGPEMGRVQWAQIDTPFFSRKCISQYGRPSSLQKPGPTGLAHVWQAKQEPCLWKKPPSAEMAWPSISLLHDLQNCVEAEHDWHIGLPSRTTYFPSSNVLRQREHLKQSGCHL